MKKLFLLLSLPIFALSGCGKSSNTTNNTSSADNKISNSPKESVALTVENFSTYVAINSSSTLLNNSYNDVIYYSYFVGADYCKFVNCTVTYKYKRSGTEYTTEDYTVALSLSGDGQADPYFVYNQGRSMYYFLIIVAASGTVEVYR